LLRKNGALPGDVLYLTKPLGSGVITTAHKNDSVESAHLDQAVQWMLDLNGPAARLIQRLPVRAATDITGFGLLGHAHEMAYAAGVRFDLMATKVPLMDGALDCAAADFVSGGQKRNQEYLTAKSSTGVRVTIGEEVDPVLAALLFDPQTSGGLLFAVPGAVAESVESLFASDSQPVWRIGHVQVGANIHVGS